ncbi:unnamed protein product [Adineta steineri]|uniref:Uncharacterized protein n=2 Tax=Adineta steineri TaxID=433720 RepID=A0A813ML16_9BILA|nr:unnamed protein product [Adineta steineri]
MTQINKIDGEQGDQWKQLHTDLAVPLQNNEWVRIIVEGVVGPGFQGDISIDDITWSPSVTCTAEQSTTTTSTTPGVPITYPPSIYDCNFECNCTCQWKHDDTIPFKWIVRMGSTSSFDTGPDSDHTTGSRLGHFIYIEASSPAKMNDTARLISPDVVATNEEQCFRFYYHMFGADTYRLNIYARINGNLGKALWQKEGNQGNQWLFGRIALRGNVEQAVGQPYQLVLEGIVGKGYLGDISIDDVALNQGPCPTSTVCDFESSDLCGYVNDPSNTIDWARYQAGVDPSIPAVDVSYGSTHGHFMFIRRNDTVVQSSNGRLVSEGYPATGGSCIRWYMLLQNKATLRVRTLALGGLNPTILHTVHGSQGPAWKFAQTTVRSGSPYQVVFEGVLNNTNDILDSIALDDVSVQSGVCDDLGACDFEKGLCGYQNQIADFNWKRTSYNIELYNAPQFDHTVNTRAGFYLWMDRRQTIAGRKCRIESELIPVDIRCITFWYYMNVTVGAKLNVYIRDPRSDTHNLLWSIDQVHGSFWVSQDVQVRPNMTVNGTNTFTIVFEGVVGAISGDLAIDDISQKVGNCLTTTPPPNMYRCLDGTTIPKTKVCDFIVDCKGGDDERLCGNCTFDATSNPLCGWSDVSKGTIMWKRGSNETLVGAGQGPPFDHTSYKPEGNYVYLTSSNGTTPGAPARFITPVLREASTTCLLEFWVYLTGTSLNQLTVMLLTGNQIERATLQRFEYKSMTNWTKVNIEIGRVDTPFQIAMDSKRTSSFGWVAFDDTKLLHCHLPPIVLATQCQAADRFHCARGSCIAKARICDMTDDCGDHSDETSRLCSTYQTCTFDTSFCDWTHDNTTQFKWELFTGPSPSDDTGPNRDHTTGYATGGYALIEASYPQVPGHKARLISRPFEPKTNQCNMVFYYHMFGADVGELNVYVRFYSNGPLVKIYGISGDRGNVWLRHELKLNYTTPFQVLIEGVVGGSFLSDIGLDDTVFSPACEGYSQSQLPITTITSTVAPTPCPGPDQVHCAGTSLCIDKDRICDFTADCPDASDEDGCGPCNFEKDNCGWEDVSWSFYSWSRVQASDAITTSQKAPPYDHTYNNPSGWYMHVAGDMGDFYDLAELRSPSLPPSSAECQITFYYWLVGNSTGTLELFSSTASQALWSKSSAPANRWNRATVNVGANRVGWKLFFELEPNLESFGVFTDDVAIDDISFSQCSVNRSRHILECDFETDLCLWETKGLADFEWTRGSSQTSSLATGPPGDHTTGKGYYVYIEASIPQKEGDRARLQSPLVPATTSSCLVFYYHMFGADIGTLNVMIQTSASNSTIYTRSGPHGNVWQKGEVDYRSTLSYKIIFEGIVGKSWEGDIALDDIDVSLGNCPISNECNFEHGLCAGWEHDPEGDFNWTRSRNGSTPTGTPTIDHTLGSAFGHFLYIDPTGRLTGDTALIMSPSYKGSQPRCLRLWYHLFGAAQGTLQIQQQPEIGRPKTLWTRTNDQDNIWRQVRVNIPALLGMSTYKILIAGIVGSKPTGDLAIDDLSNTEGECPGSEVCTFQDDYCTWVNGPNNIVDDFDWLRNAGGTPSYGTGPSVDHTFGTAEGMYIYIEASDTFNKNAKAWLMSEHYEPGPHCLVFYYHLYGEDIGTLNVYSRIGNNNLQLQWSLSGDHGDAWRMGAVNVNIPTEFYFIIEGLHGGSFQGDMALDDILVLTGSQCTIPTTTTTAVPTTTVGRHTPLSCNFENDTCRWTDDSTASGKWSRHQGQQNDFHTGPHYDHTLQTADGWYIDTSDMKSNQTARLVSTMTSIPTRGICFRFWYRAYGSKQGKLNLLQKAANGVNSTLIYSVRPNLDIDWREVMVYRETFGNYQFILEATVGNVIADSDNIAVDDITSSEGPCPMQRFCDFESSDICGYTDDPSGTFNWTRNRGTTGSWYTGPPYDHTTYTSEGYYMYVETSLPRKPGDVARLISPTYPASKEYNCLQFYYHQLGADVDRLNVYKRDVGGSLTPTKIFTAIGDRFDEWHVMEINIVPARPFNIIFEGVVGKSFEGDIALDDVFLKERACPPIGSCDFEQGMCTYKNSEKDREMDWLRMRGEPGDNTIGTIYGTYLAFDMTSTTVPSNRALLVSADLDNTAQYCFQYYYRRHGDGQGTLTINRQSFANLTSRIVLKKHESTDFTTEWKVNQISLTPLLNQTTNVYRLLFEAISVSGVGRLMLDDFELIHGACPALPNNCSIQCDTLTGTKQCIPTSQICDFNKDCINNEDERACGYDCTFERDQCNYTDPSAGLYKWRRQRAGLLVAGTTSSPGIDHTTLSANGYYMIVSTNNGTIDEQAHLLSPTVQSSSSTCEMTFYYHMSGVNVGRLEVLLLEGLERSRLWSIEGNQGDRWHKSVVKIGRLYRPFRIRFDARKTATTLADITIDDIEWNGCNLPLLSNETTTCESNQFQCKRGGCIDQNRVCDYTDDCGDKSDEDQTLCTRPNVISGCNFETDLCKFTNEYGTALQFERGHAFTLVNDYAPERDHTLNNIAGSFVYVNTIDQPSDRAARLRSSRLIPTDGCKVRFYYYMNSATTAGELSLYIRNQSAGLQTYLWSSSKVLGHHWERQEVLIPTGSIPTGSLIELLIEVKSSGVGGGGFIALDDISFSSQCNNSNGYLPYGTTPKPIGTSTRPSCPYQCKDGTCIAQDKRCNFIPDCSQGEDEVDCGQCDFETSACGWQDESTGYYMWARRNASSVSLMPGDLTTNKTSGFVMTVAGGSGSFAGSSRLVSQRIASASGACHVQFGLYRYRDTEGTLSLYHEDDSKYTTRLWTDPKTVGRNWTMVTVSIGRRRVGFRLVFISTHQGSTISSDISIDDFKFVDCDIHTVGHCEGFSDPFNCSNGNCIHRDNLCDFNDDCGDNSDETVCDNYVEMCDFENHAEPICSWTHDSDADFQWQRIRGEQSNTIDFWYDDYWQLYGPDRDHTLGTPKGHLLFLETSAPRKPNDTARVISPVFAATTNGECQFRFWYHMYGYDIGELNIYTRIFTGGPLQLVYKQNGSRGDEWLRRKVVLNVAQPFQVVIEGVRGRGYEGDIGVDDTSFTPGCKLQTTATLPPFVYSTTQSPYCNATHSHCFQNTRECIPKDQFCNFNIECTDQTDELSCPSTCTFEQKSLCNWKNDNKQKLNWDFGSGHTSSTNTGPSTDHTTHSVNGTYIYLETSTGFTGDKARLISPIYRKSSKTCMFTFWYHMYGDTIDTLNIHVLAGGIDTLIWSLKGDQGNEWLQGIAYLPTCASEFNIIVEGIRGSSFTGDIALDDFRFDKCYENVPPPTCAQAVSDPTQFMCQSKHCIPKTSTCDYELDCCDGSDEDELLCYTYQRCDFEAGSCSWENSSGSELMWERYRANALSFQHRPPYDHTTRSLLGHFYMLRTNATVPKDTFGAVSTYLGATAEQGCTMRFWIYFKGTNNGELVVGYRYAIGDTIIPLSFTNYQSCSTNATVCSWQRIEVSLNAALTQPTEIIIGARTGADRDAIMALDDITFTPQCVKFNGTIPTRPPTTSTTPYTGTPTTSTTTTTTPYTGTPTTSTTTTTTPTTTTSYRECAQYICYNNGICKPSPTEVGKPICECQPGYSGAQCETKEPQKKSHLGGILGGIFGALAVIALIIVGYIFVLPKIRAARSGEASALLRESLPIGPITNPAYSETAASSDA